MNIVSTAVDVRMKPHENPCEEMNDSHIPVAGTRRITPKIINIDRVMILPVLANIYCPPDSSVCA
ncbi:MAG: hypothetical protein WBF08_09370 [Candidatus Bathyarchaeia archaeon]